MTNDLKTFDEWTWALDPGTGYAIRGRGKEGIIAPIIEISSIGEGKATLYLHDARRLIAALNLAVAVLEYDGATAK